MLVYLRLTAGRNPTLKSSTRVFLHENRLTNAEILRSNLHDYTWIFVASTLLLYSELFHELIPKNLGSET